MRLLDTSSRLATSAMRVPAKPRSMTTAHVVSRISLRRSATVGFFTAANAIAAIDTADDTRSDVGRCERIEDAGEAGRMNADRQLLENADATFGRSVGRTVRRVAQRLHVEVGSTAGIVDGEAEPLAADHRLALPHSVGELGMAVAEATHLELLTRLEHHRVDSAVPVDEVVLEVL